MNFTATEEPLITPKGYPARFPIQVFIDCNETAENISGYTWRGFVKSATGVTIDNIAFVLVDDWTVEAVIDSDIIDNPFTDCGKYLIEADESGGADYLPYLFGKITVQII